RPAKRAAQADRREQPSGYRRRRTRGRDGDAQARKKPADARERNRIGLDKAADGSALSREPGIFVEKILEGTAKRVEEKLVAGRTAEGARDEDAPEIQAAERHADARGHENHLTFNGRGDEDAHINQGHRRHRSTPGGSRATRADVVFDGASN